MNETRHVVISFLTNILMAVALIAVWYQVSVVLMRFAPAFSAYENILTFPVFWTGVGVISSICGLRAVVQANSR